MRKAMVRKQIYLPERQNQILKKLAKQRRVSEAEVIRYAIEREAEYSHMNFQDSRDALDSIFIYVDSLRSDVEYKSRKPYQFNRQELYEERENRWIKEDKRE